MTSKCSDQLAPHAQPDGLWAEPLLVPCEVLSLVFQAIRLLLFLIPFVERLLLHMRIIPKLFSQRCDKADTNLCYERRPTPQPPPPWFFFVSSGAEIRPLSQWDLGDFFPNLKKNSQSQKEIFFFFWEFSFSHHTHTHTHKLHDDNLLELHPIFLQFNGSSICNS